MSNWQFDICFRDLRSGQMQASREERIERYRGLIQPALPLEQTLYPYGFAVHVSTNAQCVLNLLNDAWGSFEPRFSNEPIKVNVEAVEYGTKEPPLEPVFTLRDGLMINVADPENMSVGDLRRGVSHITLSPGALQSPLWMQYFLVCSAPLCHIAGSLALPVHAGCVASNGRGILLCGESGDGKSTLSFACARAGWTYVTDDATYFVHDSGDPCLAVGNCYQIRFRPSAAELFSEVEGREVTPRAAGKPSIEIPIRSLPEIDFAPEAHIEHIVFLNRRDRRPAGLSLYDRDAARDFMRCSMFGTKEGMLKHEKTMERVLAGVQVWEMHYSGLDWAIKRLERLLMEGE
ncbi:MAG: aldolase [Acidobacteria bacterium]|nr:aldolase [Acidobacteriota bacterium]